MLSQHKERATLGMSEGDPEPETHRSKELRQERHRHGSRKVRELRNGCVNGEALYVDALDLPALLGPFLNLALIPAGSALTLARRSPVRIGRRVLVTFDAFCLQELGERPFGTRFISLLFLRL
jgi:hypothetical protein